MPRHASALSRLTRRAALAAVFCVTELSLQAAEFQPGIAFVTSTQGSLQSTGAPADLASYALHTSYELSGQSIRTGDAAGLCFALSNGVGISIGADSQVQFEQFQQLPFSSERASLELEPSRSQLAIRLSAGSLALACPGSSPSSVTTVSTPHGTVRIHSGHCRITYSDEQTRICTYSGNLSFSFAQAQTRAYLPQSTQAIITRESAQTGRMAQQIPVSELPANFHQLAAAAKNARQRVYFTLADAATRPLAIQIVAPEYYEQSSARPYTYREQLP